jgi:hypothetical protein
MTLIHAMHNLLLNRISLKMNQCDTFELKPSMTFKDLALFLT